MKKFLWIILAAMTLAGCSWQKDTTFSEGEYEIFLNDRSAGQDAGGLEQMLGGDGNICMADFTKHNVTFKMDNGETASGLWGFADAGKDKSGIFIKYEFNGKVYDETYTITSDPGRHENDPDFILEQDEKTGFRIKMYRKN